MRILHVVGARPNFMKIAPILRVLELRGRSENVLLHTGQHYDPQMSEAFFRDLGLRSPDINLEVGSGTHAEQTAHVMLGIEPLLTEQDWDVVVVVGDVNSTLAAALAAAKVGVPVAHVEAGLRSGDWSMPEEVNRVLTDRLSTFCLTPSREAGENLLAEGIDSEKITFVGNVMIDCLMQNLDAARCAGPPVAGLEKGEYVVATIHRPSNVDDPAQLSEIIEALETIAASNPVVFPMHPRTAEAIRNGGHVLERVRVLPPQGYRSMLSLQADAGLVITDSGGIQEETSVLGIPCLTLRTTSERPLTLSLGTNRLVPDRSCASVLRAFSETWGQAARPSRIEGWDGMASERIAELLERVGRSD